MIYSSLALSFIVHNRYFYRKLKITLLLFISLFKGTVKNIISISRFSLIINIEFLLFLFLLLICTVIAFQGVGIKTKAFKMQKYSEKKME